MALDEVGDIPSGCGVEGGGLALRGSRVPERSTASIRNSCCRAILGDPRRRRRADSAEGTGADWAVLAVPGPAAARRRPVPQGRRRGRRRRARPRRLSCRSGAGRRPPERPVEWRNGARLRARRRGGRAADHAGG